MASSADSVVSSFTAKERKARDRERARLADLGVDDPMLKLPYDRADAKDWNDLVLRLVALEADGFGNGVVPQQAALALDLLDSASVPEEADQ